MMFRRTLNLFRRQVWARLPLRVREAILYRAATPFAPSISPEAPARGPIIVVGMLSTATGLGAAARASHDALKQAGLRVYGVDLTYLSGHEAVLEGFAFEDGREVVGEGTILLFVGGYLVPLAMLLLGDRVVSGKHVIGHWFWELPRVPDHWRRALPFVHEICVNTRFVADALRPIADGKEIHIVPYPLAAQGARASLPSDRRPFTVLVVFNVSSNFPRKNPCAAIAAFRRAFGSDPSARLIIKHGHSSVWPQSVRLMAAAAGDASNIQFIDRIMDDAELASLYSEADVVMSLHRSEGLGLIVAEAMSRGLPVIATDWSGTTDFLDARTGLPIGYRLVPLDDPQGTYRDRGVVWAEPDVDAASAALRRLYDDAALRATLGTAAAQRIREAFDPERYVGAMRALVGG